MPVSICPGRVGAAVEPTIAGDASTGNPRAITWHLREVRLLETAFSRPGRDESVLPPFDLDLPRADPERQARDEAAALRLALHHALRGWEVDAQWSAASHCGTPEEELQVWDRLERVRRVLEARDAPERERALAHLREAEEGGSTRGHES